MAEHSYAGSSAAVRTAQLTGSAHGPAQRQEPGVGCGHRPSSWQTRPGLACQRVQTGRHAAHSARGHGHVPTHRVGHRLCGHQVLVFSSCCVRSWPMPALTEIAGSAAMRCSKEAWIKPRGAWMQLENLSTVSRLLETQRICTARCAAHVMHQQQLRPAASYAACSVCVLTRQALLPCQQCQ